MRCQDKPEIALASANTFNISYIHSSNVGWVELGDGDGMILRITESTAHRIERVND